MSIAVSKLLLTEFGIHYRSESCVPLPILLAHLRFEPFGLFLFGLFCLLLFSVGFGLGLVESVQFECQESLQHLRLDTITFLGLQKVVDPLHYRVGYLTCQPTPKKLLNSRKKLSQGSIDWPLDLLKWSTYHVVKYSINIYLSNFKWLTGMLAKKNSNQTDLFCHFWEVLGGFSARFPGAAVFLSTVEVWRTQQCFVHSWIAGGLPEAHTWSWKGEKRVVDILLITFLMMNCITRSLV